ncbi:hypothetical protein HKD37_07G018719 [Glycine soja]
MIQPMATPLGSPPPPPPSPPPPPPPAVASQPPGVERPTVHVDPATGKADGPNKKKLRIYLGIVARDKVDVTYETWNEVPVAQMDLIWEDIMAEFDILEASDGRTKKKILQTVGERKWALAADKDSVDDTDVWKKAQAIQKQNTAPHLLSRGGYEYLEQKLMVEKTKKKLEEVAQFGSTEAVIDPPSPITRHVKWKMARTKKTGQMTSKATKEIVEKILSHFQLRIALQGSFVPHKRQDLLTTAIGRPEHPGRVRAAGAGVTIKQYFGSAPRTFRSSSSMAPQELEQLTQQIRDQLEESISKKSQLQSQIQSQGLALPPELEVGPSTAHVSTKGCCVDPSATDPDTGDSDKCGLYIEENPSRLVALGRVYEGSTAVHNIPLLHGQVKVTWDATVFVVFNEDFPLYIKHEDLFEIAHGGQCLNISVIQLWILAHWQMVVILPKENLVVWFCSLHNRLDNYLKGILNSALKGLDGTPQPKSKAGARPLEAERLKALRIQCAHYYLKVRNQT